MSTVRLIELPPSPNCIAVRLAAGYKNIPLDRVSILGVPDRSTVIEATGQPFTPAIQHGDVKLYDSGAILRYLDANFDGPRLYAEDYDEMRELERLEAYAKNNVGAGIGPLFGLMLGRHNDTNAPAEASKALQDATAEIEQRLADKPFLCGDAPLAPDFVMACRAWYGMVPEDKAPAESVEAFFREHLFLGEGRDRVRAWVERCMAFDRA